MFSNIFSPFPEFDSGIGKAILTGHKLLKKKTRSTPLSHNFSVRKRMVKYVTMSYYRLVIASQKIFQKNTFALISGSQSYFIMNK
jgi:hypothetical protein